MRKIALVNRKGGVHKTTTTVNLGARLAALGYKVLLIDIDAQKASLTHWLLKDGLGSGQIELADILLAPKQSEGAIVPTEIPGMDLIPGSARTVPAEAELESKVGPDFVFQRILSNVSGYDFALMDCPPSLSRLVKAAIVAADELVVPMKAQSMSLVALDEIITVVNEIVEADIRDKGRPPIRVVVVEPGHSTHTREVRQYVIDNGGAAGVSVFQTAIRRNDKGAEAFGANKSIFEYAPSATSAKDYRSLCDELLAAAS